MPILHVLVLTATLLVALLAPGCGSTPGTAPSAKNVTLTLWNTMGPIETEGLNEVLRLYHEKKPNITVQVENVSFLGGRSRFETAMKAGAGPDIFRADRFWIPPL
ncbi:MAG TPA: extracellular solute-binding protein, partial [Candidatus Ozemobacteraceae bacterium]|nr:extracellular solute-binding protein [Candidatus Ozemobacteraceae bacterium]